MKKIIILAMVALGSIVVNGAQIKWSASYLYDPSGTGFVGWTDTSASEFISSYSFVSATLYSTTETLGTAGLSTATMSNGELYGSEFNVADNLAFVMNGEEKVSQNELKFYFEVIVSDSKGQSYVYTSEVKEGVYAAMNGATTTVAFGDMMAATTGGAGWKAVPEPTSGLLLLMGMGALALRRKQK